MKYILIKYNEIGAYESSNIKFLYFQDDEVGDGTTSVVVFASELLREVYNDILILNCNPQYYFHRYGDPNDIYFIFYLSILGRKID